MQRILQQLADKFVVEWLANSTVMRTLATRAHVAKNGAIEKSAQAGSSARERATQGSTDIAGMLGKFRNELMKLESDLERTSRSKR
jgi:hypothetical protein